MLPNLQRWKQTSTIQKMFEIVLQFYLVTVLCPRVVATYDQIKGNQLIVESLFLISLYGNTYVPSRLFI